MSDQFEPYSVYLSRSGKQYDVPPEVGRDIGHYTQALLRAEERERVLVGALQVALATNGGPIDHADTVDGKAYVMVEMEAFRQMEMALRKLEVGQ